MRISWLIVSVAVHGAAVTAAVGFDLFADRQRLAFIQELVAGRAVLRVDANQGYSQADGVAFVSGIDPTGIELVEQTCAAGDWPAAKAVAEAARQKKAVEEAQMEVQKKQLEARKQKKVAEHAVEEEARKKEELRIAQKKEASLKKKAEIEESLRRDAEAKLQKQKELADKKTAEARIKTGIMLAKKFLGEKKETLKKA